MSHAHNAIIRGLNAIIQQAPYVKASTEPGYSAKDVKDLLCYVSSWVKMVHHHHGVEETFIFPEVEKLSGRKGFMDDPKHQHEVFHDGLERLLEYAESTTTSPQNYRWTGPEGMKQIVDSFSKDLTDHLYAEIDLFLAMGDLDNEGLKKVWKEGAAEAKKQSSLGLLVGPRTRPSLRRGMDMKVVRRLTLGSTTCSLAFSEPPTRPSKAGCTTSLRFRWSYLIS